jgi:hypothetical protein
MMSATQKSSLARMALYRVRAMNMNWMTRSVPIGLAAAALGVAIGCTSQKPPQESRPTAVAPGDAHAASPYKPTATFQEVMDSIVDPAVDHIWNAVATTM